MKSVFYLLIIILTSLLCLNACQKLTTEENTKLKPNPQKAAIYNTQLGLSYLKNGDTVRAKQKLITALSQDANSPRVNSAMAYLLEEIGEIDKARFYYNKALVLEPDNGAFLNNWGAFLCRHGQVKEALHYFLEASKDEKYESCASAYENAGLCALKIPDTILAKKYFKKALLHEPGRSQSLYELVLLELHDKNYQEALEELQKIDLKNELLLTLAINVAQTIGEHELVAQYKNSLQELNIVTT